MSKEVILGACFQLRNDRFSDTTGEDKKHKDDSGLSNESCEDSMTKKSETYGFVLSILY